MTAGESTDAAAAFYGRPTAVELLEAARDFLADDVLAATEGRVRVHTQVTIRVLDTVARQLRLSAGHLAEHADRLAALGYVTDHELVAAIRAGHHDQTIAALPDILQADVQAKLEVANPRHLAT